ncbi:hypothetical protein HK405_000069, partial [Cladochytrium tenue]
DVGEELARALLDVQTSFDIDGFEVLRTKAFAAVAVRCLRDVSRLCADLLVDRDIGFSQKLFLLRCIADVFQNSGKVQERIPAMIVRRHPGRPMARAHYLDINATYFDVLVTNAEAILRLYVDDSLQQAVVLRSLLATLAVGLRASANAPAVVRMGTGLSQLLLTAVVPLFRRLDGSVRAAAMLALACLADAVSHEVFLAEFGGNKLIEFAA